MAHLSAVGCLAEKQSGKLLRPELPQAGVSGIFGVSSRLAQASPGPPFGEGREYSEFRSGVFEMRGTDVGAPCIKA